MSLINIHLPTDEELETMSLDELKAEWKRIGPYYRDRFEMDFDDYALIKSRGISVSMMIENLEKGEDRWYRIK